MGMGPSPADPFPNPRIEDWAMYTLKLSAWVTILEWLINSIVGINKIKVQTIFFSKYFYSLQICVFRLVLVAFVSTDYLGKEAVWIIYLIKNWINIAGSWVICIYKAGSTQKAAKERYIICLRYTYQIVSWISTRGRQPCAAPTESLGLEMKNSIREWMP